MSPSTKRQNETYRHLRQLIVHVKLAPGSRIIESEVSKRLGMSRTLVRSALQQLEHEGFVVTQGRNDGPNRLMVAPLTKADARELMHLLGRLESLAARRVVQRPHEIRKQIVEQLLALNTQMVTEVTENEPGSLPNFFDLHATFHRTLVEAGAGPRLLTLHTSYRPQAERYFRVYVMTQQYSLEPSLEEHGDIIKAVGRGKPAVAERTVERNWRSAEERLQRAIALAGERGNW